MKKILILISFILLPFSALAQEEADISGTPATTSAPVTEEKPIDGSVQEVPDSIYQQKDFVKEVKLQGLNKITARVSSFNVKEGQVGKFGNLEISLLKCWKAPPEEEPESKALLHIWEQIPGEDKKEIFQGWMFASNPTISALEHAVYDINVLECVSEEKPQEVKQEPATEENKKDDSATQEQPAAEEVIEEVIDTGKTE